MVESTGVPFEDLFAVDRPTPPPSPFPLRAPPASTPPRRLGIHHPARAAESNPGPASSSGVHRRWRRSPRARAFSRFWRLLSASAASAERRRRRRRPSPPPDRSPPRASYRLPLPPGAAPHLLSLLSGSTRPRCELRDFERRVPPMDNASNEVSSEDVSLSPAPSPFAPVPPLGFVAGLRPRVGSRARRRGSHARGGDVRVLRALHELRPRARGAGDAVDVKVVRRPARARPRRHRRRGPLRGAPARACDRARRARRARLSAPAVCIAGAGGRGAGRSWTRRCARSVDRRAAVEMSGTCPPQPPPRAPRAERHTVPLLGRRRVGLVRLIRAGDFRARPRTATASATTPDLAKSGCAAEVGGGGGLADGSATRRRFRSSPAEGFWEDANADRRFAGGAASLPTRPRARAGPPAGRAPAALPLHVPAVPLPPRVQRRARAP